MVLLALLAALPSGPVRADDARSPGRLLISFAPDSRGAERRAAHRQAGGRVTRRIPQVGVEVVDVTDRTEATRRYASSGSVIAVEPDVRLWPAAVPDDPKFGLQWGLHNTGQTVNGAVGSADADVDAPEAWDHVTGSAGVAVAVIDTGMQVAHPDLQPNVLASLPQAACPFSADECGHATHVAGIAAARGNNALGVSGVAWQVGLIDVPFDFSGAGAVEALTSVADFAQAQGLRIVANASWGAGGACPAAFLNALAYAAARNVLLTAAAGNAGQNKDSRAEWPATCAAPNVVAVAATDADDDLADFSNYGARTVALAAPGVDVASTYPTDLPGSTGYAYSTGTSMSAPMVAGAAALVWAAAPALSPAAVRGLLTDTVDGSCSLAGRVASGGRLNTARAVRRALGLPEPAGEAGWTCYDETAAALTGSWSRVGSAPAIGGGYRRAGAAGSEASLLFTGTGVRWIGPRDGRGGRTDVYVDGVFAGRVSGYAPATQARQVRFERTGLTDGPHVLRLVAAGATSPGGSNTYLDGFQVAGGRVAARTDDPSLAYTGTWTTARNTGSIGGAYRRSNATGATFTFTFDGRAVRWIAPTLSSGGLAEVTVDGVTTTVSLYSASTRPQQIVFARTDLSDGPHTLQVRVTGVRPSASRGVYVYADALEAV